jgi:hypothetical protein
MAFSLLQEINKLSVSERAELLWALQNDAEVNAYLESATAMQQLMTLIEERDKAFANGQIQTLEVEEISARLQARRNAL